MVVPDNTRTVFSVRVPIPRDGNVTNRTELEGPRAFTVRARDYPRAPPHHTGVVDTVTVPVTHDRYIPRVTEHESLLPTSRVPPVPYAVAERCDVSLPVAVAMAGKRNISIGAEGSESLPRRGPHRSIGHQPVATREDARRSDTVAVPIRHQRDTLSDGHLHPCSRVARSTSADAHPETGRGVSERGNGSRLLDADQGAARVGKIGQRRRFCDLVGRGRHRSHDTGEHHGGSHGCCPVKDPGWNHA